MAEEAPDRDSAVAGQAEAQEDREADRARVGAAARVRAEVYGKRVKLRVAAEELEGPAAVEREQAPVAEAARVEEPEVVEDLEVDLDRVGLEVVEDLAVELDRVGLEAVEDLAVELDRVGQEAVEDLAVDLDRVVAVQVVVQVVVDRAVVAQEAVDRAAALAEEAEDRVEDMAEA